MTESRLSETVQWERIDNVTERLAVPGGWIYQSTWGESPALVFVPLVDSSPPDKQHPIR